MLDMVLEDRQAARTLPGFDPDAALVGIDFAIAVGADATAGPIAEILRAPHRAAQPGGMQDALAAHAAVPDDFLERLLHGEHQAVDNPHFPIPCAASCRSARRPESALHSRPPGPHRRSAWPSW